MEQETLKACPFCDQKFIPGEKSLIVHVIMRWSPEQRYYSQYQVECSCGATGPMCDTEAEAINWWNQGSRHAV